MRVYRTSLALTSTSVLCGLIGIFVLVQLYQSNQQLRLKEWQRYESFRLATELRQSSDDLTRMARTYVVTGDTRYERWFWDILAIRNGEMPRPVEYRGRIYWDLVLEDARRPRPFSTEQVPLQQLMRAAGITEHEFALLAEAQANSDALVNIENVAMHAMKGLFEIKPGEFGPQYDADGRRLPADQDKAIRMMHDAQYHLAKARIMEPIDRFLAHLEARSKQEVAELSARLLFWYWVAGILLVGFAVVLYFWLRLSLYILRRLGGEPDAMAKLAAQVASGNLQHAFADNIAKGSLYGNLKVMVDSLADQTRQIQRDIRELSESTGNISATAVQLASSSAETSSSISEITSTAEEVKQTTKMARDKSQAMASKAAELESVGQAGRAAAHTAQQGMVRIKEEMELVAKRIVELSEKTQNIGEIVASVNDIADQSNLLAVNASIEAAQAGEAGKGFTVVAEEVRNLADQSKEATRQIKVILDEIQRATATAVMATERGAKAVDSGLQLNEQAGATISALVDSIELSSEAGMQINASGEQQLVGIDQLATAMRSIKDATGQNVQAARQLETATRNLEDLAQRLQALGAKFSV